MKVDKNGGKISFRKEKVFSLLPKGMKAEQHSQILQDYQNLATCMGLSLHVSCLFTFWATLHACIPDYFFSSSCLSSIAAICPLGV